MGYKTARALSGHMNAHRNDAREEEGQQGEPACQVKVIFLVGPERSRTETLVEFAALPTHATLVQRLMTVGAAASKPQVKRVITPHRPVMPHSEDLEHSKYL